MRRSNNCDNNDRFDINWIKVKLLEQGFYVRSFIRDWNETEPELLSILFGSFCFVMSAQLVVLPVY